VHRKGSRLEWKCTGTSIRAANIFCGVHATWPECLHFLRRCHYGTGDYAKIYLWSLLTWSSICLV